MNTINDVRKALFATLEGLQNSEKPMDIDRAKAVVDVAQAIINSAKVEVDFLRVSGGKGSGFIPNLPALPAQSSTPGTRVVGSDDYHTNHAGGQGAVNGWPRNGSSLARGN